MNKAGTLTCGIFPSSTVPVSTSDIIQQNVAGTISTPFQSIPLTFSRLYPSTSYKVYCLTTSTGGAQSTITTAVSSRVSVTTACCSLATVNVVPVSSYVGLEITTAITVTLETSPQTTMIVSPTSYYRNTATTNLASLYPASMTVTGPQTLTFSLPASNPSQSGVPLFINLTVTDLAHKQIFQMGFNQDRNYINIVSRSSPLPPPVLLNATMSSDGLSALIEFNSPTNRASITASGFACSSVFALASTFTCSWLNDYTVKMQTSVFGSTMKPALDGQPALEITLLANKIKAKCLSGGTVACSNNLFADSSTVSLQRPKIATPPAVVLVAATVLSKCSPLLLDLSASTGAGNQPWKSIQFTVASSGNQTNAHVLQSYLNAPSVSSTFTNGFVNIPSTYLVPGVVTFTLKMCNFLSSCGTTSTNVVITNDAVPTVSVSGNPIQTYKISDALTINALAYIKLCNGNTSRGGLVYTWTITPLNGIASLAIASQSRQQNTYYLSNIYAAKLTAGTWYQLQVLALYSSSGKASQASIKLYIEHGNVIPVVSGGSNRQVAVGKSVTLDASSSFDEDTKTSTGLSFQWDCSQTLPTLNSTCPFGMDSNTASTMKITVPFTASNRSAVFQLTVTSSDNRKASISTTVTASSLKSLSISVNNPVVTRAVNNFDKLKLTALVTPANLTFFAWSCNDSSLNLYKKSLSAVNATVSHFASSLSFDLLLQQYSLITGNSYLFTFRAFSGPLAVSSNSITVVVNDAPKPGKFLAYNSLTLLDNGVELQDTFQMSAQFWTDADLPLTYSFGFYAANGGGGGSTFKVLQSASAATQGLFQLPQGDDVADFRLTTVLLVFDKYSVNTTATAVVRVTPNVALTSSASALSNYLSDAFASASNDPEAVASTISTVGAIMNSVSCQGVPYDCRNALNREDCAEVEKTCGPCLAGYIGEEGSANTKCFAVSSSSSSSTLAGSHADVSPLVSSCTSDANCPDFQFCNTRTHLCETVQQSCAKNCSASTNGGHCVYYQLHTNPLKRVSQCTVDDLTCFAQCQCSAGHYGSDCSYTLSSLTTSQDNRFMLLSQLRNLTANTDLSSTTFSSWITSFNAIFGKTDEVNADLLSLGATMINQFLNDAVTLKLSYENVDSLLTPINSMLSFSFNTSTHRVNYPQQSLYQTTAVKLLSNFIDFFYRTGVVGQSDIVYNFANYQLKFVLPNAYQLPSDHSYSLSSSLSQLESTKERIPYSLNVNNIHNSKAGLMIAFLYLNQLNNVNFLNTSARLQPMIANPIFYNIFNFQSVCDASSTGSTVNNDCSLDITIPNYLPQSYSTLSKPATYFITSCFGENTTLAKTFTYQCPQNQVLRVKCNSTFYGHINTTCPYTITTPSCSILQNNNPTQISSCQLKSYTADSVVCSCKGHPSPSTSVSSSSSLSSSSATKKYHFTEEEYENLDESRRRRLAATTSSNVMVGLSTTVQTVSVKPQTAISPFPPTMPPTKAPVVVLSTSEKVDQFFSTWRYYCLGIGLPIFLGIAIFLYISYSRSRAKKIYEIDWQAYAELLRMAIWPLKEVNDNYRKELGYPSLLLNKRLRRLLGKNPFESDGYGGGRGPLRHLDTMDQPINTEEDEKPYVEATSEEDLEVLRYFKRLLIEENEQLRHFTNFFQSNELFSFSEKKELNKRKDLLQTKLLDDEKIDSLLEQEVDRRRSLPESVLDFERKESIREFYRQSEKNKASASRDANSELDGGMDPEQGVGGGEEGYRQGGSWDIFSPNSKPGQQGPGQSHGYEEEAASPAIDNFYPSNMEYHENNHNNNQNNASPMSFTSSPFRLPHSRQHTPTAGGGATTMDSVYGSLKAKEEFGLSNPMRGLASHSKSFKKYEVMNSHQHNVANSNTVNSPTFTSNEPLNILTEGDGDEAFYGMMGGGSENGSSFDIENPQLVRTNNEMLPSSSSLLSRNLVDAIRPFTPLTTRSLQSESLSSTVPVNNPWTMMRTFSKNSLGFVAEDDEEEGKGQQHHDEEQGSVASQQQKRKKTNNDTVHSPPKVPMPPLLQRQTSTSSVRSTGSSKIPVVIEIPSEEEEEDHEEQTEQDDQRSVNNHKKSIEREESVRLTELSPTKSGKSDKKKKFLTVEIDLDQLSAHHSKQDQEDEQGDEEEEASQLSKQPQQPIVAKSLISAKVIEPKKSNAKVDSERLQALKVASQIQSANYQEIESTGPPVRMKNPTRAKAIERIQSSSGPSLLNSAPAAAMGSPVPLGALLTRGISGTIDSLPSPTLKSAFENKSFTQAGPQPGQGPHLYVPPAETTTSSLSAATGLDLAPNTSRYAKTTEAANRKVRGKGKSPSSQQTAQAVQPSPTRGNKSPGDSSLLKRSDSVEDSSQPLHRSRQSRQSFDEVSQMSESVISRQYNVQHGVPPSPQQQSEQPQYEQQEYFFASDLIPSSSQSVSQQAHQQQQPVRDNFFRTTRTTNTNEDNNNNDNKSLLSHGNPQELQQPSQYPLSPQQRFFQQQRDTMQFQQSQDLLNNNNNNSNNNTNNTNNSNNSTTGGSAVSPGRFLQPLPRSPHLPPITSSQATEYISPTSGDFQFRPRMMMQSSPQQPGGGLPYPTTSSVATIVSQDYSRNTMNNNSSLPNRPRSAQTPSVSQQEQQQYEDNYRQPVVRPSTAQPKRK
jgi:hypothetical protein